MNTSSESFLLSSVQTDYESKILPLRQRIEVMNRWRNDRINNLLPQLMNEEDIDMWIVLAREYNEDPVLISLMPAGMKHARRTTIFIYNKKDDGTIEYMAISRPGSGFDDLYVPVWTDAKGQNWKNNVFKMDTSSPDASLAPETQWECLKRIVEKKDPAKIGINISEITAFGDGLSVSLYRKLKEAVGEEYINRFVSAENLCIRWLETRTEDEIISYNGTMQMAHAVIAEGFSGKVIHPGVTRTSDVSWWMTQRFHDLGLEGGCGCWIIRQGDGLVFEDDVIRPGDIVHCDSGLSYLGLYTDTQENCYILKQDETDVPEGLKAAMREGNKLQDIMMSQMIEGRTGNEILAKTLEIAKAEGMKPCVYSHPIGYHDHGAGPTIGLYDMQQGVPGNGDFKLHNNTLYAMELNTGVTIPEWDNEESIMFLETNILFKDGKVYCIGGRQEEYHLVK